MSKTSVDGKVLLKAVKLSPWFNWLLPAKGRTPNDQMVKTTGG